MYEEMYRSMVMYRCMGPYKHMEDVWGHTNIHRGHADVWGHTWGVQMYGGVYTCTGGHIYALGCMDI